MAALYHVGAVLARDPSMLLLDEATNWLDNRTRPDVMEQTEKQSVTRNYVIREERGAKQGTFVELLDEERMFSDLARRRMT